MEKVTILIGLTLALSIAAFVLALWPVVADAPWESKKETDEPKDIAQGEACWRLVDAIARAADYSSSANPNVISSDSARAYWLGSGLGREGWDRSGPWELAGCDEYLASIAK